jgi:glycosyltransferase involved in cell wall biosynthesis
MFTAAGNCERQCMVCKVYSAPKKFATRHVKAVVGISDYLLQAHLTHGYFRESKIRRVIHNSYACDGLQAPREVSSGQLRVGYLGRLFETKGIELLIDAVQRNSERGVQLVIAGSGEDTYEAQLRERCTTSSSRVTFLGDVPPKTLFEQIDALVVPSLWHEPFGRVAIEANAWGLPVLASRRGGLPEIVEHGSTGFLFEPDQAGELARLLHDLTPARCQAMRTACLNQAQQFLPGTIAGMYETLYRQVIASATTAQSPLNHPAGTPLAPALDL